MHKSNRLNNKLRIREHIEQYKQDSMKLIVSQMPITFMNLKSTMRLINSFGVINVQLCRFTGLLILLRHKNSKEYHIPTRTRLFISFLVLMVLIISSNRYQAFNKMSS